MKIGVGVMARAPSAPGKTRLAGALAPDRLLALRTALLADTLETVCSSRFPIVVFVTPDGADREVRAVAPRPVPVVAQRGSDLGARMRAALEHLLVHEGCDAAMLVGTDIPLLTVEHLDEAAAALRAHGGVVVGPADDGGYYLIGMTVVVPALFEGIEWGTDGVLTATLDAAARAGAGVSLIRGAYDVDTIDDLRRLERDLAVEPPEVARRLRAVLAGPAAGNSLRGETA